MEGAANFELGEEGSNFFVPRDALAEEDVLRLEAAKCSTCDQEMKSSVEPRFHVWGGEPKMPGCPKSIPAPAVLADWCACLFADESADSELSNLRVALNESACRE